MSAKGKVVQIIGNVIDVEFPEGEVPELMTALKIEAEIEGKPFKLVAEVQQHIGRNQVRAVGMSSTDGLVRGTEVIDTGNPITVPVGEEVLGRILDVLGEPVDKKGPVQSKEYRSIHTPPPDFTALEPKREIFETGIKVIDLLAPYVRGGKVGLFGGAGVGKSSWN